ncbi:acylphosphatase [Candidatus Woesearchaeota archaeon]|nr:MAG: acylphosphatase [Candidatus Woesearchaeota archaeon]
MKKELHVIIKGIVQGVSFRAALRDHAQSRRVTGWVRNNPDGSVEAVMQGEEEALQKLLLFCTIGPSGARVESVEKTWRTPTEQYETFEIRR